MVCRAVGFALVLVSVLLGGWATASPAQDHGANRCRPAPEIEPATTLREALHAIGASRSMASVLHLRLVDGTVQDYQSDRTYPPFFLAFTAGESWYQPATGVLRSHGRVTYPNGEFDPGETLSGPAATFFVGDTLRPAPENHGAAMASRALDPWPVLYDWSTSDGVNVVGRCRVRDYPRVVLQRTGPFGPERLALDPATHLPVSLEREEPHYLWGQVSVAYVYSNWDRSAGIAVAASAFRMVDGAAEMSRTIAGVDPIAADSAPSLALPHVEAAMTPGLPPFLQPTPPDSVRVSDATRLLANLGYREGVTLQADTLYLLDATQGEQRGRADSAMIARLFPGHYPIVVVVTDLAWPHVAGVRYWVARGATIVSRRTSRGFLERVLARRWTRAPDLYERRRGTTRFHFVPVDDSLALAGGKLRLYAIDGLGGEGAVMAYIEGDRFLWAGDYVQTVRRPSTYATDVWRAARHAGIRPTRVAAQHLPLTDWSTVDSLGRSGEVQPSAGN
jgi:hypothetical protein